MIRALEFFYRAMALRSSAALEIAFLSISRHWHSHCSLSDSLIALPIIQSPNRYLLLSTFTLACFLILYCRAVLFYLQALQERKSHQWVPSQVSAQGIVVQHLKRITMNYCSRAALHQRFFVLEHRRNSFHFHDQLAQHQLHELVQEVRPVDAVMPCPISPPNHSRSIFCHTLP
jgi:hypothetical protein